MPFKVVSSHDDITANAEEWRIFMIGNVIVGQSGGPTSVINSSLVGVYKTARDRGVKKSIRYASRHQGAAGRTVC